VTLRIAVGSDTVASNVGKPDFTASQPTESISGSLQHRSPRAASAAIASPIMAPRSSRRSRALDSDDEDSRPNTPSSTAPNDSKRQRRFETLSKSSDDDDDASPSGTTIPATQPVSTLRKPQTNNIRVNGITPSSGGHQPGAIVRVKLINFVTYASAEFFPGSNLNMVIGPNGTGKSTLVCAICLGLGWPPSVSVIHYAYVLFLTFDSISGVRKMWSNSSNTAAGKLPLKSNSSDPPLHEKTLLLLE